MRLATSIPSFLKSINDIIGKTGKKSDLIRNNHYKDVNCSAVLDNSIPVFFISTIE